ncbi:MAG: diaminopimelate decarboxylase [Candidatus Thiodiazotropha sp. 6PLUC5]
MTKSKDFSDRLAQNLEKIVEHYGTPFHLYDEKGIRETGRELIEAFKSVDLFREYFAVKALPNPTILNIMGDIGFGFDCSSIAELVLSRQAGGHGEQIMFTSNNTSENEFNVADTDGGCILNLDDISLLDKLPQVPELICFRYNPGERRTGNSIIGNPIEAKYGVAHDQLIDAYRKAKELGVKRFGLHTMLASNELNHAYMVETARMLLDRINWISKELDIKFDFINIGGGLGIPYRPEEKPLDIRSMGQEIGELFSVFKNNHGYVPKLYLESGRYITGPHGILVTTAINRKEIYRTYVGVDSCMSALMRPGMYGAYHHISVLNKEGEDEVVDVVGSLCENNDKFAIQRSLPKIEDGDIICIHDTGAHGQAMGFNYNGKLRPKELLLREDGSVELIRREETLDDLFATLDFSADQLSL